MTLEADPSTQPRSRRNLLAVAGAGAAAAIATLVSGNRARAGHDGTNVMHVGEANLASDDRQTELLADVSGAALRVENEHLDDLAHGVAGVSTNGDGIHGDSENFHGVFGHSATDLGVFGTSGAAAPPGAGVRGHSENGDGVQGFSTTGRGVTGESESAPGGAFQSQTEFGVEGRSAMSVGVAGFGVDGHGVHGASENGTGVDGHSQTGPGVSGSSSTGPGVAGGSEGGAGGTFESQTEVGVEGRSAMSAGVAGFGVEGPGVHGASENGTGLDGHSQTGSGVNGHSHSGPGGTFSTDDGVSIVNIGGHASSFAVGVENSASGEEAGGILINTRGGKPSLEGDAFPFDEDHRGIGVQGVSYSGTSYQDGGFGEGPGTGVQGLSGSGAGVEGHSGSGTGVVGHSQSGTGGTFHTDSGDFAANIGGDAVEFALGVHNTLHGDRAGGILSTSRGGKPGIEADVFPFDDENPGVGVQGVAYLGTGYEDGEFGAGPGTGVEGISGTGTGVRGHSDSGHGGSFESSSGFGVEAHSQDLVGVGGFSVTDLGVLGIGGTDDSDAEGDGVGGFSFNSVGGRFVSFNGIGVRAVSPGDEHPALQAASGVGTDDHATPAPDGGLALEVIGKARFSTAGSASVPQGENSVFVANSAVTADSHITVTLTSDPGSRQLLWLQRSPGSGFTVHLTSAPPPQRLATDFTYLIVEPGNG